MKIEKEYLEWIEKVEDIFTDKTGLSLFFYGGPWLTYYQEGLTPEQAVSEEMSDWLE